MPTTGLDLSSRAELLHRAELLQAEAAEVICELDLVALLGQVGYVEQLGSSVSGLMVWRDIDFAVRCRDLTPGRAWDALRPLLTQPRLLRLDYRNEAGERSPTGQAADQRYYFVCYYETDGGGRVEDRPLAVAVGCAAPASGAARRSAAPAHRRDPARHPLDQGRLAPAADLPGRGQRRRRLRRGARARGAHPGRVRGLSAPAGPARALTGAVSRASESSCSSQPLPGGVCSSCLSWQVAEPAHLAASSKSPSMIAPNAQFY